MLERDTSEDGAFDQGRRNKEMKSKRVSESLLLHHAFSRRQEIYGTAAKSSDTFHFDQIVTFSCKKFRLNPESREMLSLMQMCVAFKNLSQSENSSEWRTRCPLWGVMDHPETRR